MGVIAHHRDNRLDFTLLIENNAGFHRIKVNGSSLVPRLQKHFVKTVKALQIRHTAFVDLWVRAFFQHFAHLRIGEPGVGMNDTFVEFVTTEVSSPADFHLADHCQAIDFRFQGA